MLPDPTLLGLSAFVRWVAQQQTALLFVAGKKKGLGVNQDPPQQQEHFITTGVIESLKSHVNEF